MIVGHWEWRARWPSLMWNRQTFALNKVMGGEAFFFFCFFLHHITPRLSSDETWVLVEAVFVSQSLAQFTSVKLSIGMKSPNLSIRFEHWGCWVRYSCSHAHVWPGPALGSLRALVDDPLTHHIEYSAVVWTLNKYGDISLKIHDQQGSFPVLRVDRWFHSLLVIVISC